MQNNIVSSPATPKSTITSTSISNAINNTVTSSPIAPIVQPQATPATAPIAAQSQSIATVMAPARYQTSTSSSTQSQSSQSSSPQPSTSSSSFSFDFSSNQFSGFFSSSPLFSSVPAQSTPPNNTQIASVVSEQNEPVINLTDNSFFSGFGTFIQ